MMNTTVNTTTPSTRLQMWAALAVDRHFSAYEGYSGLHPDERAIGVPSGLQDEAIRVASKEVRKGRGYVLPDGVWFDPEDGEFYEITTEED